MKRLLLTITISLAFLYINGQSENKLIRKGNKHFDSGNFTEAEEIYRMALEENHISDKANFNLGNTNYNQEEFSEAERNFSRVADMTRSPLIESQAHYNRGNALMSQERFAESIEAYKQTLRLNPNDEDARYNLEYARRMLLEQEQNQEEQQQDQDDNQQDDQEQQDQQEQQDEPDQQEQQQEQQQDQGDGQEQERQQPQQPPQISKEDAERMLQALSAEERKTLEKLNEERNQSAGIRARERDW